MKMFTKFITLSLCVILCIQSVRCTEAIDWDFLIFSQEWPATMCSIWQKKNDVNTCQFPNERTSWTVHGIWPSSVGRKGPEKCSRERFDPDQLDTLMDDLEEHWTNIHANSKPLSFWEWEWHKHGTCASALPKLNTIFKYFKQGIEWNKKYQLSTILNKGKVSPGRQSYDAVQIANAVKDSTKTTPTIQCIVDKNTNETLLSEIRLCFDTSLILIDCDLVMPQAQRIKGVITNCKENEPIKYYGVSPAAKN